MLESCPFPYVLRFSATLPSSVARPLVIVLRSSTLSFPRVFDKLNNLSSLILAPPYNHGFVIQSDSRKAYRRQPIAAWRRKQNAL